jgi:hypothetical protein
MIPAFAAALINAEEMGDLPSCERIPDRCNAVLVRKVDNTSPRHVHFCDLEATHASPDFRIPTHRCVCTETWSENTGTPEVSP